MPIIIHDCEDWLGGKTEARCCESTRGAEGEEELEGAFVCVALHRCEAAPQRKREGGVAICPKELGDKNNACETTKEAVAMG